MKNFAYKNENDFTVVGISVNDSVNDVLKVVPKDIPFYFYSDASEIETLIASGKYDGIGTSEISVN